MYTYQTPFQQASLKNQQRPCGARGCQQQRHNMSRYCHRHKRITARYGHPLSRPVSAVETQWCREKVHGLFAANPNHPGLIAAVQFVQQWMASAVAGDQSAVAHVALQQLEARGVTPQAILEAAASLYVWSRWNERALPDQVAYDFAVSRAVLSLAPAERRQGALGGPPYVLPYRGADLQGIAAHFRTYLSRFMVNVYATIETEQAQRQEVARSFDAPFQAPLAVLRQVSAEALPEHLVVHPVAAPAVALAVPS